MRRLIVLGLLLLTGCQGTLGPAANRSRGKPDDPILSIEEQQSRGRARYSLPEDNNLVPPGGIGRYGPANPAGGFR